MKHTRRTTSTILLLAPALASAMLIAACASTPKADISGSANPQEEIAKLDQDLKAAQLRDVDVLDFKDYDKAIKHLESAKQDLAKGKKQEQILDEVRFGRASLEAAGGFAAQRKAQAPSTSIFDARQAAIKAGASTAPALRKDWGKADEELVDVASDLGKLKPEKINDIQNRYVALERQGVIETQLGNAIAQVEGAKNEKAQKRAQATLKTAEVDLAAARSVVETNVRNEAGYRSAVDKANASARMLTDVIKLINANGGKMPEGAAVAMVLQQRKITDLQGDLSTQKSEAASAESDARAKQQELQTRLQTSDRQLTDAEAKVAIQNALNKARKQFSKADAEAYQQGNSLLIRLKTVAFSSGRSDLPAKSLPVLAKVSEVAKELGAAKIVVEGHTDSIGSEAKNQTLSEERASAVATYLKSNGFDDSQVTSEGYGISKPLATNKSQAGRAQNRRVDIVITPGATAKAPADRTTQSTTEE